MKCVIQCSLTLVLALNVAASRLPTVSAPPFDSSSSSSPVSDESSNTNAMPASDNVTLMTRSQVADVSSTNNVTSFDSVPSVTRSQVSDESPNNNVTTPDGVTPATRSEVADVSSTNNVTSSYGVSSVTRSEVADVSSTNNVTTPDGVSSVTRSEVSEESATNNVTRSDGVSSVTSSKVSEESSNKNAVPSSNLVPPVRNLDPSCFYLNKTGGFRLDVSPAPIFSDTLFHHAYNTDQTLTLTCVQEQEVKDKKDELLLVIRSYSSAQGGGGDCPDVAIGSAVQSGNATLVLQKHNNTVKRSEYGNGCDFYCAALQYNASSGSCHHNPDDVLRQIIQEPTGLSDIGQHVSSYPTAGEYSSNATKTIKYHDLPTSESLECFLPNDEDVTCTWTLGYPDPMLYNPQFEAFVSYSFECSICDGRDTNGNVTVNRTRLPLDNVSDNIIVTLESVKELELNLGISKDPARRNYYFTFLLESTYGNVSKEMAFQTGPSWAKYDRVENVAVKADESNSSVLHVSWKELEVPSVECQLFYTLLDEDVNEDGEQNFTDGCQKGNVTLEGLKAFSAYNVSVRYRLILHRGRKTLETLWSDTTYGSGNTSQDVPSAAPELLPEGYTVGTQCEDPPCVSLYWKAPPRHRWNGIIDQYQVKIIRVQGRDVSTQSECQDGEEMIEPAGCNENNFCEKVTAKDDSGLPSSGRVSVGKFKFKFKDERARACVWAGTVKGLSKCARCIDILVPFKQQNRAHTNVYTEYLHGKKTYVVYWSNESDHGYNLTVFGCLGSKDKHGFVCKDHVNWKSVGSQTTEYHFNPAALGMKVTKNNQENWMFGVARSGKDSANNGIAWNTCTFTDDPKTVSSADETPKLNPVEVIQGSKLRVSWSQDCNQHYTNRRPKNYTLNVGRAKAESYSTTKCEEGDVHKWHSPKFDDTYTYGETIEDLDPDMTYTICVLAEFAHGGDVSSDKHFKFLPQDLTTRNILLSVLIPVFLVSIVTISCKCRQRFVVFNAKFQPKFVWESKMELNVGQEDDYNGNYSKQDIEVINEKMPVANVILLPTQAAFHSTVCQMTDLGYESMPSSPEDSDRRQTTTQPGANLPFNTFNMPVSVAQSSRGDNAENLDQNTKGQLGACLPLNITIDSFNSQPDRGGKAETLDQNAKGQLVACLPLNVTHTSFNSQSARSDYVGSTSPNLSEIHREHASLNAEPNISESQSARSDYVDSTNPNLSEIHRERASLNTEPNSSESQSARSDYVDNTSPKLSEIHREHASLKAEPNSSESQSARSDYVGNTSPNLSEIHREHASLNAELNSSESQSARSDYVDSKSPNLSEIHRELASLNDQPKSSESQSAQSDYVDSTSPQISEIHRELASLNDQPNSSESQSARSGYVDSTSPKLSEIHIELPSLNDQPNSSESQSARSDYVESTSSSISEIQAKHAFLNAEPSSAVESTHTNNTDRVNVTADPKAVVPLNGVVCPYVKPDCPDDHESIGSKVAVHSGADLSLNMESAHTGYLGRTDVSIDKPPCALMQVRAHLDVVELFESKPETNPKKPGNPGKGKDENGGDVHANSVKGKEPESVVHHCLNGTMIVESENTQPTTACEDAKPIVFSLKALISPKARF